MDYNALKGEHDMAFNLVPAGTILPFGGATAPSGWLLCEGTAISRNVYAALWSAIGTAWGYGDNSTTFNLPDLRGRFIRGRANGSANDPDRAGRTAIATGGATGDNVGSAQVNATKPNGLSGTAAAQTGTAAGQTFSGSRGITGTSTSDPGNHGHNFLLPGGGGSASLAGANSGDANPQGVANTFAGIGGGGSHTHTVSGSTDVGHTHAASAVTLAASSVGFTGDNETRPLNANVNYIIKI